MTLPLAKASLLLGLVLIWLLPHRADAQPGDSLVLSDRNMRWVETILADTGLVWGVADPRKELLRVVGTLQSCLAHETARIDSLEHANADAALLSAAWADQKSCTAVRDAAMKALILPAAHPLLMERLYPPRPAVLHFGVHNRMNCDVCIPLENLPVRETP